MTRRVFVDTGAFVALANAADQYHSAAVEQLQTLRATGAALVTSNFVLDETYTRIRRKAGHKVVIAFGEKVRASRQIRVITIAPPIEKQAWEILKKYADQEFSFTDCTSFALMRAKKITEAFAFDADFKIMGFALLDRV
ncbi:MAG: PIN domain-containing protein [Deltaproteobacteria bacterium]|nr:PIN domain-containing protein [Deltaproteobacteria bacterium]